MPWTAHQSQVTGKYGAVKLNVNAQWATHHWKLFLLLLCRCVCVCVLVPKGFSLNSRVASSRSENKDVQRFFFIIKTSLMKPTADMQEGAGSHGGSTGRQRYTNMHVSTHNRTISGRQPQDMAVASGSCHTFQVKA